MQKRDSVSESLVLQAARPVPGRESVADLPSLVILISEVALAGAVHVMWRDETAEQSGKTVTRWVDIHDLELVDVTDRAEALQVGEWACFSLGEFVVVQSIHQSVPSLLVDNRDLLALQRELFMEWRACCLLPEHDRAKRAMAGFLEANPGTLSREQLHVHGTLYRWIERTREVASDA